MQTKKIPQHIAMILDGNGRWAKRRGLPRIAGHRAGAKRINAIVDACMKRGIKAVTMFTFSTENWDRPKAEVDFLMNLAYDSIEKNLPELQKNDIRVRVIGRRDNLEPRLQEGILKVETETAKNSAFDLVFAFNYSGKWDIVNATQKLAKQVEQGKLKAEEIDVEKMSQELCLADLPPVDLLIRTSGEFRISNFLLWQLAYSELYFPDVLWPAFTEKDLDAALEVFTNRERRFGAIKEEDG